jgi:hypothetical protein
MAEIVWKWPAWSILLIFHQINHKFVVFLKNLPVQPVLKNLCKALIYFNHISLQKSPLKLYISLLKILLMWIQFSVQFSSEAEFKIRYSPSARYLSGVLKISQNLIT